MKRASKKATATKEPVDTFPRERAKILREAKAFLRKLESWCEKNRADTLGPEHQRRVRAITFAEIFEEIEGVVNGDLSSLWNPDAANRWIDAALAAGVTFERHTKEGRNREKVDVAFQMSYGQISGTRAIADAFARARRYGPDVMDKALEERFGTKDDVATWTVTTGLGGEVESRNYYHVLGETGSELAAGRLGERIKRLEASLYKR